MSVVVIAYWWLAILLYVVLGGADFGAGIIELVTARKNKSRVRKTVYHAIGPIWEANHMWLIIAIVILFVGFPDIYSLVSIHLHWPMLIMLMGIIARGTAFSFRNYDAVKDDMQWWYTRIFISSSFVTPLFLGIIAGSTLAGTIDIHATNFLDAYVFSWLSWFSVAVGLFTVALCGFLASVYLIGEADNNQDRRRFRRTAREMNIASFGLGAIVFVAAAIDHVPLASGVFGKPAGLISVIAALVSVGILWYAIGNGHTNWARALAGFQVTMILFAASNSQFPDFIQLRNGASVSLWQSLAQQKAVDDLGYALLIGSVLILPALYYLYYSFERRDAHH